jgi:hypothetical protein
VIGKKRLSGAGEVEAPGFYPAPVSGDGIHRRPPTKGRTRRGENPSTIRTRTDIEDCEGVTAYREQVVCSASRYRKDTLGSDQWLQSRGSGVCMSRRRKVTVG